MKIETVAAVAVIAFWLGVYWLGGWPAVGAVALASLAVTLWSAA